MLIQTLKEEAALQAQLSLYGESPYALAFIKPRSKNWPLIQEICRKFGRYIEHDDMIFVLFDKSVPSLKALHNILTMITGWNSALLFVDGECEQPHSMTQWLGCYIHSFFATSPEAYCLKPVFTHFGFATEEQYLSPCRLLGITDRITPNHPASLAEQVHSLAIDNGCFRCPNFNAENFRVYS